MVNNGMLVCSFNFRERFKKVENIMPLNHPFLIEKEDSSLTIDNAIELFSLFCQGNTVFTADVKKRKIFAVEKDSIRLYGADKDPYAALSFVIKSGSYGVKADITDINTNAVTYHRSEEESDVKDFLCVVYIPKDMGNLHIKKGIFVFQSIGNYGVKTITTDTMRSFFAEMNLTLETRSVSVSAFLEKLIEQGSLYKLTLIKNKLSPNLADNILISTGREEQTFIKPTFQQAWLGKMYGIFQKADTTGIIEIPEGEDFDDIAIQFKLGGATRTVRLSNLDRVSIIEDIPESIVKERNVDKIIQYMIQTANAYKERMVWGDSSEV